MTEISPKTTIFPVAITDKEKFVVFLWELTQIYQDKGSGFLERITVHYSYAARIFLVAAKQP